MALRDDAREAASFNFGRMLKLSLLLISCIQLTVTPVLAFKKTSSLSIAFIRIHAARSSLTEVRDATSSCLLVHTCSYQLGSAEVGLNASLNFLSIGKTDEAVRELLDVDKSIDSCVSNLGEDEITHRPQLILKKIGHSVSSAIDLVKRNSHGRVEPETNILQIPLLQSMADSAESNLVDGDGTSLLAQLGDDAPPAWSPEEVSRSGLISTLSSEHFPLPPAIFPSSMDDMHVDYCSTHVRRRGATAIIRLDRSCGGKFHSPAKYSSGVFSVSMKPYRAPGLSSSFYISSNDNAPDLISFDLVSNFPNRILTSFAANGKYSVKTFSMGFDTTTQFHDYTIKWDSESVIWMVDDLVLRTLKSFHRSPESYPRKPGHVYGYFGHAYHDMNSGAGQINWDDGPFEMIYTDLRTTSPLGVGQWQPPKQQLGAPAASRSKVPVPIQPLVIDYGESNVNTQPPENVLSITFDMLGRGGRIRSLAKYSKGIFRGKVKCPDGDTSGLLTSLYLSSSESSPVQDEIDFEFMGDNKRIVQTNFYANGVGGHEQWIDLGFDCSQAFHAYTIRYTRHSIQWLVDNKLVRTVRRAEQLKLQRRKKIAFPSKNVHMYASVWNASDIAKGGWTGPWHGHDLPYIAKFRDLTIQSPN